jgi:uncharacterized membrane protein (UPF0182 family)
LAQLFQNKPPPSAAELSGLPGTSPSTTTPTTATTAPPSTGTTTVPPPNASVAQLLQQASDAYNEAQAALRRGDLAAYQSAVDRMADRLRRAQAAPGSTGTAPSTGSPGATPSSTPTPST